MTFLKKNLPILELNISGGKNMRKWNLYTLKYYIINNKINGEWRTQVSYETALQKL